MTTEVYYSKPDSFKASISVAAIYVRLDQKLLLLQLSTNKSEAGCWGVPAGKLDQDESPIEAAKRELQEETGLSTGSKEAIKEIGSLYMRKPGLDYVYHLFELELTQEPAVRLSAEHCSYKWASRSEAVKLPLMAGAIEALEAFESMRKKV